MEEDVDALATLKVANRASERSPIEGECATISAPRMGSGSEVRGVTSTSALKTLASLST